ncbi:MAG: DUF4124 domain-containing protein [Methylococcaceae bacterium]|nr:DUF4124 domain-containing protein [Methylococcaceae bacterium]
MLCGQVSIANAKKMYRWIDDNGNIFYSDKVSPKDVKHRRESLNESARVVRVVEKQKTKAELELLKRLVLLRKQQEAIINKQKSHDKVLLSTFRSVGDMNVALKGQMLAFDGKRKVVRGNLNRLEQQLLQKQRRAAQYERDGRRVPVKLLTDIAESKAQIDNAYVEISNQFQKKKKAREQFERDIARFAYLIRTQQEETSSGYQTAKKQAENELGLFICETVIQCERAWVSAKQFVRINSTVAIDIETDTLIMSQTPYKDNDLSLSVSMMSEDDGNQQLFLDIRCRKSSLGDELCRGIKVKEIRHSFSDFIKSTLPEDAGE